MKKLAAVMLLAVLVASGCAQTPQSVMDNGVRRAATEKERDVATLVEAQGLADKQRAVEDAPTHIQREITSRAGVKHIIDAEVYAGPPEDIKTFTLEPIPVDYERVKPIFLKGELDAAFERPVPEEPAYPEWVVERDGEIVKRLQWAALGTRSVLKYFSIGDSVDVYDFETGKQLPAMPVQDQQAILDAFYEAIDQLGLVGATIYRFAAGPDGCIIDFYPQYTRLAALGNQDFDSPDGTMHITIDEIVTVRGNFMQRIRSEEDVPKTLAFDDVLRIAEQHISRDDIATRGAIFDHVALAHQYSLNDKHETVATPVWWFHAVEQENPGVGGDYETGIGSTDPIYDLYSFRVDAVTGLIQ